jgi:hypothetical protein
VWMLRSGQAGGCGIESRKGALTRECCACLESSERVPAVGDCLEDYNSKSIVWFTKYVLCKIIICRGSNSV